MESLDIVQSNMYLIGQAVKKYRHNLKWSQEYLLLKANLDKSYIGNLERGEQNATIKSLTKISIALGINIFVLLRHAEELKNSIKGK